MTIFKPSRRKFNAFKDLIPLNILFNLAILIIFELLTYLADFTTAKELYKMLEKIDTRIITKSNLKNKKK